MKYYIRSYRGILAILALIVSITFLGNLAGCGKSRFYKYICEEDLIDIIEPESIRDGKIV